MRAWVNLRHTLPDRARIFKNGLERVGYRVEFGLPQNAGERDIFISWNRVGSADAAAKAFEKIGRRVLVTENAAWGNDFAGDKWYTIANNYHNTAGCFAVGDTGRWDSLNIHLDPFREDGETVILPQRGIGSAPVAMPKRWLEKAVANYGGRVRQHPGRRQCVTLEQDLQNCGRVITWGSGAAIKALMMGIPVVSEMPNWIAEQNNTEAGRLDMFRRLAWAQWRHDEISSGSAFDNLLSA